MVYDEGAVLLLESDPKLRASLVKSIQEFGRRPVEATDVEEALEFLQTTIPGLVVVSLDLPRGDGYDLCEQLRRMVKSTWPPILVTSHRASPLDIAFAEEAGANGFLKKPFTANQLFRYVGVLLDMGMPSVREMRRLRPSEPPPNGVLIGQNARPVTPPGPTPEGGVLPVKVPVVIDDLNKVRPPSSPGRSAAGGAAASASASTGATEGSALPAARDPSSTGIPRE